MRIFRVIFNVSVTRARNQLIFILGNVTLATSKQSHTSLDMLTEPLSPTDDQFIRPSTSFRASVPTINQSNSTTNQRRTKEAVDGARNANFQGNIKFSHSRIRDQFTFILGNFSPTTSKQSQKSLDRQPESSSTIDEPCIRTPTPVSTNVSSINQQCTIITVNDGDKRK